MDVFQTIAEVRAHVRRLQRAGKRTALVPTMGCLHEGHMSLVRIGRSMADEVVVSIFVNPTQFGPGEDYERYPRRMPEDLALCRAEAVGAVFCPSSSEMYAPDHSVVVDENRLTRRLCGAARPGHFCGVATVVTKLFNIVQPDVAVFGQKDAQQARLLQRVVRDLNIPVEMVIAPIVREDDGLAMSSRNAYLSPGERRQAVCLYRSLQLAERMHRAGERDAGRIKSAMLDLLAGTSGAVVEYVDIADDVTLDPVDAICGPSLVAVCVRIGKTRLIDNTLLPA